jgi:hypothetical protein
MRISTQAKLISTVLAAVAIAAPIAHGETGGSYPQLETGKGFSFKAPSYWSAGPSYWSTAERMITPITPRVAVNRSLGVPPQYLGTGTQTQPRTPRLSEGSAGFDWSAAAIGAGIVAALFLMIASIGAIMIRARKSQRAGRLSAT